MKTGIELIADEREEQIKKHGKTEDHDIEENYDRQLSQAASNLCNFNMYNQHIEGSCPHGWDDNLWHKICTKSYKERLIIAGALIAAEIDRLKYC